MLTGQHRAILAFEETHWVHTGRKQNDIRETFGIGAPRYYAILLGLIHNPDAVVEFPQLAKRMLARKSAHENARRRFLETDDE